MINEENVRFTLVDPLKVIDQYINIWNKGCNEKTKN